MLLSSSELTTLILADGFLQSNRSAIDTSTRRHDWLCGSNMPSQYSHLQKAVRDSKFEPPRLLRAKVHKELGSKTGKGFYDYAGIDIQSIIAERDRH